MAVKKRNIVLCGFMGTGKTSVGKRLSELLGRDFVDLDSLIEADAGMAISRIFASQGEPAFRALEARMVERVARRAGCVVAAGGGTIVDEKNLKRLKRNGIVVTLTADTKTILRRVGAAGDRPLLRGRNKAERIRALMAKRAQAYARADIVIDTSCKSIDEVAQAVLDRLPEYRARQRRA
jgi:shikimate kinase